MRGSATEADSYQRTRWAKTPLTAGQVMYGLAEVVEARKVFLIAGHKIWFCRCCCDEFVTCFTRQLIHLWITHLLYTSIHRMYGSSSEHDGQKVLKFLVLECITLDPAISLSATKVVLSYLFMFTLDCLAFPVHPSDPTSR